MRAGRAPVAILLIMRATWLTRFKSVLLSILVLSGGGGTSLIDALVYHTRGEALRSASRVATTDAPRTHAAACILGAAVPVGGGIPNGPPPVRGCRISTVQPTFAPQASAASGETLLHNPRAPPAHSA